MKKVLIILFGIILLIGISYASQEIIKDVDDLKVKVFTDNDPPAKGENNLNIILTDLEGKPVTKAKIKVDYSMPPMGSMPAMIYKTRAKSGGEGYKAKINLSMSGHWNIALNIKRPGKSLAKMMFELKVP